MTLSEAIRRMEENPGLKMCMPRHYRSWQYNYYDKKKGYHCIETGEMWDIGLSFGCNEIDGYEDYN